VCTQGVRGGACAATALVKDGELYVANVGDCRAVLCSSGGVATALTSDHTAGREDERRRIESSVIKFNYLSAAFFIAITDDVMPPATRADL
jgi:serine/threonine protein phosphatase PrpC